MTNPAFAFALFYGRYSPIPWGKWKICMKILSLGKLHPWRNPVRWQAVVADYEPEVVKIEGLRLKCDWRTDLGMLMCREYEPYLCRIGKEIICPGDVVLDVGANIGFFSLFFARCAGPDGEVYAYEPVASTAQKLRYNLSLNEHIRKAPIQVREKGLSNRSGIQRIFIPVTTFGFDLERGQASILSDTIRPDRRIFEEDIELVDLDNELIGGHLDFVKCDVEGAEKLFLEGGIETLRKHQPM